MTHVEPFFDPQSHTHSYVVHDGANAVIIDPVLEFDMSSGHTSHVQIDKILSYIQSHKLHVHYILETHAHADHISGAQMLKAKTNAHVAIGEYIKDVQTVFAPIFNDAELLSSKYGEKCFDALLKDNQTLNVGTLNITFKHTPGHTPACGIYVINNEMAFVGDTIFMPDSGTARCDFPGGSATTLFNSIRNVIFNLKDETTLYMCHDYGAGGKRDIAFKTTVKEQKENNIHVALHKTEADFVDMRTKRDATLSMPTLIIPSIQTNIRAGNLPTEENNGVTYLKIPVNQL